MESSRRGFVRGACLLGGYGVLRLALDGEPGDVDETSLPAELPDAAPTGSPDGTSTPRARVSLGHDPERPTELLIDVELSVTPGIETMTLVHGDRERVTASDGMVAVEATRYEWDGESEGCALALALDVAGVENDSFGGLDYAGTRHWLFAPVPTLSLSWTEGSAPAASGSADLVRDRGDGHVDLLLSENGFLGETSVYLGSYTTYDHEVETQRIRLVVPGHAVLDASPTEILETLAFASRYLGAPGRVEEVVVFVTTHPIRRGGMKMGDGNPALEEAWVREDSPLDSPDSTWIHEYVHTTQAFRLAPDMGWFREASAEYLAARIWWERQRATATPEVEQAALWHAAVAAVRHLRPRESYASSVLADERRWSDLRVPYRKGGFVLLALDSMVRERTDGHRGLADVLRAMCEVEGPIDLATFLGAVRDVSGVPEATLRQWAVRYVEGSAVPSLSGWWRRVDDYVVEASLRGSVPATAPVPVPPSA